MLISLVTTAYGEPTSGEALEKLLLGVAAGNREALAELYRRTRGAVYGFALSCLKHAQDAQDVTQDTYVRVWESIGQYRPQGKPMAWMLTVTRNLALQRLRERGRSQSLEEDSWDSIPADAPAVTPEDRDLLQRALGALSDRERKVVLLHAAAGLKHREIAALLELPLATVLSQYHRALKKLNVQMKGDDAP